MYSKMKCLAVIPCYNDESFLKDLIPEVKKYVDEILLIDDGSKIAIPDKYNCYMIRNRVNRGKGYSIKKSLSFAIEKGFSHIITLDADGQHSPRIIPDFLNVKANIDIVLGRRDFNASMPLHRRLSNKITSWLVSWFTKQIVYDSQCGFRRYKVSTFNKIICLENGFQYESEVLIKGLKGTELVHVDIPTIYSNEKSSINNLHDSVKFIRLVLRSLIEK